MRPPRTHRHLGRAAGAVSAVATIAMLGLTGTPALAHTASTSSTVDRPCGADAPWTASVTASSGTYQATWTVGYTATTGDAREPGAAQPVATSFRFDLGPYPADLASVDVTLTSTWYKAVRTVVKSQVVHLERPPATDCPTTEVMPTAPNVEYDCVGDAVVVIGGADTDSIDYTVSVDDGAGEGTSWSATVTAVARDGFVIPAGVTTEWTVTGTVGCDALLVPEPPGLVCRADDLVIDLPVHDAYTYEVDGTLPVDEGADYSLTITAVPNPGQAFDPASQVTWVLSGTVDCIDEAQLPPPRIVEPPAATPPTGNPPQTLPPAVAPPATIGQTALELPRTGSATVVLTTVASVLTAAGALILATRRRSAPA